MSQHKSIKEVDWHNMPESKIQTATGMCVVDLTKYLVSKYNLSLDEAFLKLQGTLFFSILNNPESGLFTEQNDFLFAALDKELEEFPEFLSEFLVTY